MSKLDCTSETAIAVVFLLMNLEKWLKSLLLSLFFLLRRFKFNDNGYPQGPQPSSNAYYFAVTGTKYGHKHWCVGLSPVIQEALITSNKAFSDWAELLQDPIIVTAILDRLLHHSAVISIQGNSYRLMGKQVKVVANEIRKMN
jgi:hypothetical protein